MLFNYKADISLHESLSQHLNRKRAGPEKAVRPYYKIVRPRMLKLQANLSPNWSYDKILID